jgi:hypothetical protein
MFPRMRDGTVLYADVYGPLAPGRHPVMLLRIPYNKRFGRIACLQLDLMRAASQGYVLVMQDPRGYFNSDGDFYCSKIKARTAMTLGNWRPSNRGPMAMLACTGRRIWAQRSGVPPSPGPRT